MVHDISQCCAYYPTLQITLDDFIFPNGFRKLLVALKGTIPITYKGAVYHIPVHIWITPNYPSDPPLMFVVPTAEMVFRQHHLHVDHTNGLVYLPYLSEWNPSTCKLQEGINAMIMAFSKKIPVYSRVGIRSMQVDEKTRLLHHLSQRMIEAMENLYREAESDIMTIGKYQEILEANKTKVTTTETRLRQTNSLLLQERNNLVAWHSLHPRTDPDDCIDDVSHPRDVRAEQMIQSNALHRALNEAMDQIDEGVVQQLLDHDTYVTKIRKLAREQFFARALSLKVTGTARSKPASAD